MSSNGERKRTIKMICPSLSKKIISVVAWEGQKLELGSIAAAFGLNPRTLKLNGHFIGRGVDMVASSVTWQSLLSFFSARGLSTGASDSDALIVDGKLVKVGSKRQHDSAEVESLILSSNENQNGERPSENVNWLDSKRPRDSKSALGLIEDSTFRCKSTMSKRRISVDDQNQFKRNKIDEPPTGLCRGENSHQTITSARQLPCSLVSGKLKRTREEDDIVAAYKRIK